MYVYVYYIYVYIYILYIYDGCHKNKSASGNVKNIGHSYRNLSLVDVVNVNDYAQAIDA